MIMLHDNRQKNQDEVCYFLSALQTLLAQTDSGTNTFSPSDLYVWIDGQDGSSDDGLTSFQKGLIAGRNIPESFIMGRRL